MKKIFLFVITLILFASLIYAAEDWPPEKRFTATQPDLNGLSFLSVYVADNIGPNPGIVDVSITENGKQVAYKKCNGDLSCVLIYSAFHVDGGSYTYKAYVTSMETGKKYELPSYCCQHTLTFPRYELKGTVKYQVNNIYNVLVNLFKNTALFNTMFTGITGQYSFLGILSGNYNLEIIKPGFQDQLIPITTMAGVNKKDIVLIPAAWSGTISGTVYNANVTPIIPVSDAEVIITQCNYPPLCSNSEIVQIVKSDASGNYTINGLPLTVGFTYDLDANVTGYNSFGPSGINLNSGQTLTNQDIFLLPQQP